MARGSSPDENGPERSRGEKRSGKGRDGKRTSRVAPANGEEAAEHKSGRHGANGKSGGRQRKPKSSKRSRHASTGSATSRSSTSEERWANTLVAAPPDNVPPFSLMPSAEDLETLSIRPELDHVSQGSRHDGQQPSRSVSGHAIRLSITQDPPERTSSGRFQDLSRLNIGAQRAVKRASEFGTRTEYGRPSEVDAESVMTDVSDNASSIFDENYRYRRMSAHDSQFKESFRRSNVTARQIGDRLKRDRSGVVNFSTAEIRKLFRSFDRDNDHVLQHKEFQQGMLMMGLEKANDPYAFSKIIEEVDVDQTGLIDEEEFTNFFRKHKFDEIEERLEQHANLASTTITVTEYGYTGDPTTVEQIDGKRFAKWLKINKVLPKGRKRWFDIRGYNLEVMQLLGMTYDLHGEMIKDAGCLQPNKIDIVKRKSRDGDVAQIVVQTLTMQGSPFTNDSCDNLVTAGELFRFQPHMTQRQLCILCLGDSTLITIVKDNMVGTGQDDFGSDVVIDLDGPTRSHRFSSTWMPTGSLVTPTEKLFYMLDSLRSYITDECREDVMTYGMKYMVYLLLSDVFEYNFMARDMFATWLQCANHSVQDENLNNDAARDAAHLRAFSETIEGYAQSINMMKEHLAWVKDETTEAHKFFTHQVMYFEDCNSEISAMATQMGAMMKRHEELGEMLSSMSDHRTNATLYVLTIVTTLVMPAQFLAALYGMNFVGMPELEWEYGYLMFWVLMVVLTALVALVMKYHRFL